MTRGGVRRAALENGRRGGALGVSHDVPDDDVTGAMPVTKADSAISDLCLC